MQTATPTRAIQLEQKGRNVSICACSMPREIVTQQQGGTITVHREVGEFGEFKVRPAGGDMKAAIGPSVWTGRALQAESDDREVMGLALLYPALDGTFVFLAIMDIRARSISFASRPRRP